ncbi:MAG: hypothetical protein QXW05_00575 [Ignisphaera sp.]
MQRREISILIKSTRYLPIIFMIIALLMLLIRVSTVYTGGTENPKDPSPI